MTTHSTLSPVEAVVKAIDALLHAIEGRPGAGAEVAYRSAIGRHGRQLFETGGAKAMRAVLDEIAGTGPDQNARRAIVLEAWARVPGWHLGAGAEA